MSRGSSKQENPYLYTIYPTSPTTEYIPLELLRTDISIVLSCHVCEITINTLVKLVYILVVHVLVSIKSIILGKVKYMNRIDNMN